MIDHWLEPALVAVLASTSLPFPDSMDVDLNFNVDYPSSLLFSSKTTIQIELFNPF